MGELNADLLRELSRWRRPRDGELAHYQAVWEAVSSDSPERLIALCEADASPFDWAHEALQALMARYPAVGSGLNVWDRKLLETCREVRLKAARIVGETMGAITANRTGPAISTSSSA